MAESTAPNSTTSSTLSAWAGPYVTNMLGKLDGEGLVKHEKYRGTVLTEEGHRIARAIIERHETLTRFLRLFGLEEETIYRDVEGMEHHVSRPTLAVIRAIADLLESHPALLEEARRKIDPQA